MSVRPRALAEPVALCVCRPGSTAIWATRGILASSRSQIINPSSKKEIQ